MTVSVSNTNLSDSFNTWRLNTNYVATVLSNNVVTVSRAGSADRGGVAIGNGHIVGTFSAESLRTPLIKSGNTTNDGGWVVIASNTSINATSFSVTANTTFHGNVNFTTSGSDRIILGDISRIRLGGGSSGEFLKKTGGDVTEFASLTLRDIADLSTNSAHIILSGANSSFSDNGDSPSLIMTNGADKAYLFLASDATLGDSDVYLKLVDSVGDSAFVVADSSNTSAFSVTSDGVMTVASSITASGNVTTTGVTTSGNIAPSTDDSVDLGETDKRFKDLYLDGVGYIDELSIGTSAGQGVSTSLIPKTDSTSNLGSTTRKWSTIWGDTTNGGSGVFKTLGVSGSATSNGNLTVNGSTTLNDLTVRTGHSLVVSGNVASDLLPTLGAQYDLGSLARRWQFVYANNLIADNITANSDVTIDGNLTVLGTTLVGSGQSFEADDGIFLNISTVSFSANGDVTLGNDSTDTISMNGQVDTHIIPNAPLLSLGSASSKWRNAYFDGDISANNGTFSEDLTVTKDVDINGDLDVSGDIINDGTVIISSNGKMHANNAVKNGTLTSSMLANTMNLPSYGGYHGSANTIPIIRVNAQGQIVAISNTTVAGITGLTYTQSNNNIRVSSATGKTFDSTIGSASTTSGTGRGVASFDGGDFSVSSGHVSLKDATTGAVLSISGTTNEVEVSRTNGTVTVGLPDDVTVTSDLMVGGGVFITGNLVVSGTTSTINSETVNIADNKIVLNSNYSGSTPTEDAGIVVERGTKGNYEFIWDESAKGWSAGTRNISGNNFLGNATTANTLANTVEFSITGDVVLDDGLDNPTFNGSNGVQLNVRISNTSPSIIRVYDVDDTQVFP